MAAARRRKTIALLVEGMARAQRDALNAQNGVCRVEYLFQKRHSTGVWKGGC